MSSFYPLTPLQKSMYASSGVTGQPWRFIEQIIVDLPSERLDPKAMQQAWADLVSVHPVLSAVIVTDGYGDAGQSVQPNFEITPVVHDWEGLSSADAEQKFQAFVSANRTEGIDATSQECFQINIFQLGPMHSKLLWTFPHSLLDGGSFAPLLEEVFTRYANILQGHRAPALNKDEREVFKTHCEQLASMSHDKGVAYFAKALQGWEGSEGLVPPDAEPSRKVEIEHRLTKEQSAALKRLADRAGVSLSNVIMAAWGVVLARSTGQKDVVFGNTRNGRGHADGARDATGCFITTVPVRTRLDPGLTVGTLLKDIQDAHVNVSEHEFTPLTDIRRVLDIPPGRQIFDSVLMCDYDTLDERLKKLGGKWNERTVELLEEGDTAVSVAVYMGPLTRILIEYDPVQVPEGHLMHGFLVRLLENFGNAGLDTLLGTLSMLDDAQTSRLVEISGPDEPAVPGVSSCISRFEEVAARHPDRVALVQAGQEDMTFGQLDRAALRMAGQLAHHGVRPGDHVGICMERSAAFVIAMFAIWKAGAAFVPMDSGYPAKTLNIIAQDGDVRFVLTDSSAPALDVPAKAFDGLGADLGQLPGPQQRGADDLAYLIFTSGSTGRPKGVMITHASLAAHASAIIPLFGLSAADRVLQFAALSFDVALEEIIPTLVAGATLVLRTREMSQSIPDFLEQCVAQRITVANLPTGFWVALTDVLEMRKNDFPPLIRLMIVGGERVPFSVFKRWRAAFPDVRWLNGYGPTETTITCTTYEAVQGDLSRETVPIGRAVSHARTWVLATDGALAPEGTEGELFISGPAVAKGYVGDPARTASKFSEAQFDPDIGRIYGTGDRVTWQDGLLHFRGRMDRQIKLRGYRIEPGQIEAALEAQDDIERAHAAVYTPPGGTPQLVAWYSAANGAELPAPKTVKEWVAHALPQQMRPQLVAVSHWPQTPGGKIDFAQLPAPTFAEDSDTSELARTPLTQEVIAIFEKILRAKDVGPATSFFDAGGDSLSLLRLMPELEQAFGSKLKPANLYGDPTPRGVVRALQENDPDPLVVIPIQPEGALAPLFAVHVLGDNGSFFRPLAQELGQDRPLLGLTVGLLTKDTPTTIEGIAQFYLHQIERQHPEGPLSLIAVSAGSYVTMELAHKLLAAGRDVRALILLDAEGPDGRDRVGRFGRARAHLLNLLTQGWPYVQRLRAARADARAENAAHEKLQSVLGNGAEAEAEEIENVADFIAANQLAIENYKVEPYPRRLTIYRAGRDRFDSKRAITSGLGWSSVAAAGFDICDVPGDHLGILDPPNVKTLAERIAETLTRFE